MRVPKFFLIVASIFYSLLTLYNLNNFIQNFYLQSAINFNVKNTFSVGGTLSLLVYIGMPCISAVLSLILFFKLTRKLNNIIFKDAIFYSMLILIIPLILYFIFGFMLFAFFIPG